MWEQSLIIRLLTVLVVGAGNSGYAISYCSSSFRFDQLCPDPRHGSRVAGTTFGGGSSNLVTDTNINLNTDSQSYRGGSGGFSGGGYMHSGSSSGYGGKSYASSMSIKDPSTTSCDFYYKNEVKLVESAVIMAIHVTEKPWPFRQANQCNNIVKLNYASFDGVGLVEKANGGRGAGFGSTAAGKQSICQNDIGYRIKGSQNEEQLQAEKKRQNEQASRTYFNQGYLDEEIGKKMNVYFWHNFTLYSHSAKFLDKITNYNWSKEDISCVSKDRRAQYVQIAISLYKSERCEIIVQQYKIDETRSPFGCSVVSAPISNPFQFCGSYNCSQNSRILTSLKLFPRRDVAHHFDADQKPAWDNQGSSRSHGNKLPTSSQQDDLTVPQQPHHSSSHDDSCEEDSNSDGGVTDMVDTAPKSQQHSASSGDSSANEDEDEEKKKPMDWIEALFLVFFPSVGVVSIVVILLVLRSRSAREICRGYSYPRPPEPQHMYIPGSFNSIDKSTLPI